MAERVVPLHVGIREMTVMADIGVNSHEIGRRQPLIVTASLWIDPVVEDAIGATVDYRDIAAAAAALAGQRIALVETFAQRLAAACVALHGVRRVRVTIDKPQALPSGIASVTTMRSRPASMPAGSASSGIGIREDA